MALTTNFNFNPYYDDYDENKKFLRILFKPGYSVQARELTQLQSMLQKQIERMGNNIFLNGVAVLGGESNFQNCRYLKLQTEYSSVPINISDFVGKTIYLNDTDLSKRGEVVVAIPADDALGEPPTLLINQVYGSPFSPGDTIRTNDAIPSFAVIENTDGSVGDSQAFVVQEGVYYYNGYFVKTDTQSIAISKYNTTSATLKVGFEINEYFVSASDDSSLLDPAQEATNYQAPGSDRYKLELVLATRSLDSTDLENFIQLAQFKEGIYQSTKKTTVYNKITDDLARRTFDESGNYVVRPFSASAEANTSNSANVFNIIVGTGKAYIQGYEVGMEYKNVLQVDKAKETDNVSDKLINSSYGNYFFTSNHSNTFNTNQLVDVDLHCVYSQNVSVSSTSAYNNTKIGTAKVKSQDFVSSANSQLGSTYVFAVELFDVDTRNLSGVVSSVVDATNIIIDSNFSDVDDAYTGAFFRVTSGPGSNEGAKLIVDYDGLTRQLSLSPSFITSPNATSTFNIEFNVQDVESMISLSSGTTINASCDISQTAGIDISTFGTTNKAILFDSKIEELVFNVGSDYIKEGTVNDIQYSYVRRFTGSLVAGVSGAISIGDGDSFRPSNTDLEKRQNYTLYCISAGGSSFVAGQLIPSNLWSVSLSGSPPTSATFTVTGGASAVIEVFATVDTQAAAAKGKTFIEANTADLTISGATSIVTNQIDLYSANGQIHFQANSIVRIPDTDQSLYVCDVLRIAKIIDFEGQVIDLANFANAVDVTERYTLVNGQRDSFYDHSSIRLKPNFQPPEGPIVVYVDRFTHPLNGTGFFSVNSYPSSLYESIPAYLSSSGKSYELKDCLDFRPSLVEGTITKSFNINTTTGPKIPKRNSALTVSYDRYLGRIDKLILSVDGRYSLVRGVPSDDPVSPPDQTGSMTLYEISIPPYTDDITQVQFKQFGNRRYTMKDIGQIDSRLKNVEYYNALSLLENDAVSKSDVSLFGRTKNGVITDSFVGLNVVDMTGEDFSASIDRDEHELRPAAEINSFSLVVDEPSSTNYRKGLAASSTNLFFLRGPAGVEDIVLAEQGQATTSISVNPYNVQLFIGAIRLKPQSDIWIDINRLPDVIIQDPANAGMINFINESRKWAQIEWGSWNRTSLTRRRTRTWGAQVSLGGRWFRNDTWAQDQINDNQRRTGTLTYFVPQEVRTSLGDNLINSEVIPWMRKKEIIYAATAMEPTATIYPFFDNESIKQYVSRHNYFTINTAATKIYLSSEKYREDVGGNPLFFPFDYYQVNVPRSGNIHIKKGSEIIGNAVLTLVSGNRMYVDNVALNAGVTADWDAGNIFLERWSNLSWFGLTAIANAGGVSPIYANVKVDTSEKAYVYTTGTPNVSSITTSTSLKLSNDAANAYILIDFGNTPIRTILETPVETNAITNPRAPAAEWSDKQAEITAYDASTLTLTLSKNLQVGPNSVIQIGELKTDGSGRIAGSFYCPRGKFRTGEKKFRLTGNPIGDFGETSVRADTSFYAEGLLNTVEERILATIRPRRVVENFTEDRSLISFENMRIATGSPFRVDPLAETFLVEPTQHPDGIMLSRVRVCFSDKDEILPVILQIRPSVNGYPSATDIYPFAEVTLQPNDVQVSDYPSLDDPNKYTEFVFDAPVHLAAGEHSIVLLSNSNKYKAFIAVMGQKDLNTNADISAQPFTGSFFKSQNGQTWTAEQDTDMMFRIYYYQFSDNDTASIVLTLADEELPDSNVNFDLLILQTQEVQFPNASISYTFNSERRDVGGMTGFQGMVANEDVLMLDRFGERVINPNTGNTSLTIRAQLTTRNRDISPVLDLERFGVIPIAQILNNLELRESDIFVSNTGSYSNGSNISVTISGGGGNGALAVASVINTGSTNTIDAILLLDPGSGYKTSPTITITGGNGTPPATGKFSAVVTYNGENKRRGGNSEARYITKKVVLADGFSSGDLRVYLTAHKPAGSAIDVYCKLLAGGDKELWTDKNWQLMTQIENAGYYSENYLDFAELVFAPGINNKANNIVSYTSPTSGEFFEFNSFAVKIVLSGTDTVDVPRIRDFRAIAIPAG